MSYSGICFQESLFFIPEFFGEVNIVCMGIFKTLYLVPEGVKLLFAAVFNSLNVGEFIAEFAFIEDLFTDFNGTEIG